jgi:hypothetical protein
VLHYIQPGSRAIATPIYEKKQRPLIRSTPHAPDQTVKRSPLPHCSVDLAAPSRYLSTLDDFHDVSRAVGPSGQSRARWFCAA